ncbi:radical SAM protein, partial [Patescibacteria group bacterium]
MKYYIKTLGCQMNFSDSERISACLEKNNLTKTSNINEAGLVVFNTCGVRQMAEDRVYGQIHNLKKNYPSIKIILTGCLSNRKDVQRRLKSKVDLFTEIKNFPSEIENIIKNSKKISMQYLKINPNYNSKFQVYVPIMTGCNNFCAYCVVPYARGREISRPADEIIKEIKKLTSKGYKEITLLGQNVNSYR